MLARIASDPHAAATFDEAISALGYDVRERDDVVALASTVNVQLGLLVAAVASARILEAHGVRPNAVAGHSVGGFGAAVCAGALCFAHGSHVVVNARARWNECFLRATVTVSSPGCASAMNANVSVRKTPVRRYMLRM